MSDDSERRLNKHMQELGAPTEFIGWGINRDTAAQLAVAYQLKRIADTIERLPVELQQSIYNGITEGIYSARPK